MKPWVCIAVLMFFLSLTGRAEDRPRLFGVLEGTMERAKSGAAAGWNVAVIAMAWDAFEPEEGKFDRAVVERVNEEAKAYRALGYRPQLDLGFQYPPGWIFALPDSRFRNQFGDRHESNDPGRNVANAVFNQAVRDRMEACMEAVFRETGTDWDWVRLGGGFYGEVNFPLHRFAGKTNCYWAFDDLAQGKRRGLPSGLSACPVPGWKPGDRDPASARTFVDWYLGALQNYHDWQIRTARRWYSGELCMLYGSWGLRPGWLETAVAASLDGSSAVEGAGEIAAGSDWARLIGGIGDPRVIVYCTWLDAPRRDCEDDGTDAARWSPVHWQSSLAAQNPRRLKVWGENTGQGGREALDVTFERVRRFGLMGVLWAFERDLVAEPGRHLATFAEYAAKISGSKMESSR
jgi:hypothetical protein